MSKYIVEESYKPTYDKNYKISMINTIPVIVWSIPFYQKLFPNAVWWLTFSLYAALSYISCVVIAPGIASVIIFSGLFCVFADYIGNQIVKVMIVSISILVEIAIFANATVHRLEWRRLISQG